MKLWNNIRKRARREYHVNIFNNETFEQRADFNIRLGQAWLGAGLVVLLTVLVTSAVIAFSPVRELIPGYTDTELVEKQKELLATVESLREKSAQQDSIIKSIQRVTDLAPDDTVMLRQIQAVLNLESSAPSVSPAMNAGDAPAETDGGTPANNGAGQGLAPSEPTSATSYTPKATTGISFVSFRKPVEGSITRRFDSEKAHFAIDIATTQNAMVRSSSSGVVIMADYTLNTGYVIGVLHPENYISFYKHNKRLLRNVGSFVNAGDPIAIAGNSGEMSSGPHLHFELWKDGRPIDPLNYLRYN